MIIGVTGTNGAGKGTVVEYLVQKGFKHYWVRDFLVAEITRRGMQVDRSAMRDVANDLRQKHGPSYVVETLYANATADGGNSAIESIRVLGEVEFLKAHGVPLIAVDAERKLRYERVVSRGSSTDKVDFDTWVAQEEREWAPVAQWDMDIPGVMKNADYTLQNNGTLEELHQQIDAVLRKISA
jgi:dephospho-CoA kinase